MPRKKNTEPEPTPAPIAESNESKSTSRKRATDSEANISKPVAKATRSNRTKAEATAPLEMSPAPKARSKKPSPTPEPAPAPTPTPAPKETRARKSAPTEPKSTESETKSKALFGRSKAKAEPEVKSIKAAETVSERPRKPAQSRGDAPVAAYEKSPATDPPQPTAKKTVRKAARQEDPRAAILRSTVEDLPVPIWRPRQPIPANASPAVRSGRGAKQESKSDGEPNLAPRRTRNKKGDEAKEHRITAAAALVAPGEDAGEERGRRRRRGRGGRSREEAPVETVAVAAPAAVETSRELRRGRGRREETPRDVPAPQSKPPATRKLVPIPPDAPQVVTRDGIPVLTRGGRIFPPLFFFGSSPDEKRAATVVEEMRMAAENGVKLYAHLVELEVDPASVKDAVSFAGYLLKKTLDVCPDAQVLFRVVFTAPRGWQQKYPKAAYVAEEGGMAEPSLCDDIFWGDAEACLRDFITTLRRLPHGERILGIHLERGEWFFAAGWGYDTSPAAYDKFREWVRVRYRDNVVSLRAAWFDGQVHFATVSVPEYGREPSAGEEFVRTGRKARRWVDYHLFLSDTTVERIGKLAYAVKEASEGYFVVSVSYGYTFEWSHPASGHLSLGKLLRTPEVDMIAGPPSYRNREPGGAAPFPGPIDSFALNGKLYISEEDFKTSISGRQEPDDFNPIMRTPQALESVHWRGVGAALSHMSGVCWMDLWGNGWLSTPGIWERGASAIDDLIRRMAAPPADPDVAVFIDERSLAYLVDQHAFTQLVQNVREAVLRSGLNAAFYLLSDLAHRERFPESKLYVFMNAWDIRPEVRSAIKGRLQRDGKVLFWLYAAGLFDGGRDSLERVREVTGIALKPQPFASKTGTTLLNRRHILGEALPEKLLADGGQLEPSYFAIPEDGVVLGEYSQTGLPSFVFREFTHDDPTLNWKSVFLGEPVVTPALFRALGEMAGAPIWNYQEDVVHVRPPFLTVHCSGAGVRAMTLPDKWAAFDLVERSWVTTDATHLRFTAIDGETHVFLVGPQTELESLLQRDPQELLTMAELPERAENTLQLDSVMFDVPIMKLDEWVEETWSEDLADDLLLKPSMFEPEAEEPIGPDRERGRRRRGRRKGGEEVVTARREGADMPDPFDALGMNVVFRKRN